MLYTMLYSVFFYNFIPKAYSNMNSTRVLIACEESQEVTKKMRILGVEAFSCDIMPCSGGHPEWHIQGDVTPLLKQDWDMIIAFPPCTHLANSGARWFKKKRENGKQQEAIDFFMLFANAKCSRIAIENPIGIMSSIWRKPDQIIHPWMFGHPESKATCFWLKGLPKLKETKNVKFIFDALPKNKQQRLYYLPPSKNRGILRSKTFFGIAEALSTQYIAFINSGMSVSEWESQGVDMLIGTNN